MEPAASPHSQTAALVGVRGIDQHQAADLVWVCGGEHPTGQPTVGVPDQQVGAGQAQFLQGGVQTSAVSRGVMEPPSRRGSLQPSPGRS